MERDQKVKGQARDADWALVGAVKGRVLQELLEAVVAGGDQAEDWEEVQAADVGQVVAEASAEFVEEVQPKTCRGA